MNKPKKTKVVAKAKTRKSPVKAVVAAPPEKNGFMWKLLERKEAELKARKQERLETPYENRYNHYNTKKKTG